MLSSRSRTSSPHAVQGGVLARNRNSKRPIKLLDSFLINRSLHTFVAGKGRRSRDLEPKYIYQQNNCSETKVNRVFLFLSHIKFRFEPLSWQEINITQWVTVNYQCKIDLLRPRRKEYIYTCKVYGSVTEYIFDRIWKASKCVSSPWLAVKWGKGWEGTFSLGLC